MNRQRKAIAKRPREDSDHRIVRRLCALPWMDDGQSQERVAQLLGVRARMVGEKIKLYRKVGLGKICDPGYRARACYLTAEQIDGLLEEIKAGRVPSSRQVRQWLKDPFGVKYCRSEGAIAASKSQLP